MSITSITPIAFAVTALVGATLLVAAQRTHAAEADGNTTELLPTADPCGSCDRPIAQAPTGAVAPQSLPAPPRNTGGAAGAAFKLNDLRLNGVKALATRSCRPSPAPTSAAT